jgi:uncharacterized protein YbjT (DUF2867 family)
MPARAGKTPSDRGRGGPAEARERPGRPWRTTLTSPVLPPPSRSWRSAAWRRAPAIALIAGATGAFLLMPPNPASPDFPAYQRRIASTLCAAVRTAKVPHVVVLSSIGADLESGLGPISGLNYFERLLRETGTKLTALRPGFFMENVGMSWAAATGMGIYPSLMPAGVPMPMIATRDIAAEAARALLAPPPKSQVIDLVGPAYRGNDVAALIGERLGKASKVVEIPPAGWQDALVQAGLTPHFAGLYVEMYTGFGKGLARPVGDRMVQGKTELRDVIAAMA